MICVGSFGYDLFFKGIARGDMTALALVVFGIYTVIAPWVRFERTECETCRGKGLVQAGERSVPANEAIVAESCHSCGYSLAAHSLGDRCPECGTVVATQCAADRHRTFRQLKLMLPLALVVNFGVVLGAGLVAGTFGALWGILAVSAGWAILRGLTRPDASAVRFLGLEERPRIIDLAIGIVLGLAALAWLIYYLV